MIRAIGNTPAPAPTQTPAPAPAPTPAGEEKKDGQNLAFKRIVIKNVKTKDFQMPEFIDFLKSGNPSRKIKGGNVRSRLENNDVFTWDITKQDEIIMGKTKKAEDALYKDLMANKDKLPGIEIYKIDDWA